MSGSLTVIGGHSGSTLTGLVNIPVDQTALSLGSFGGLTGVQLALTAISDAVTLGAASFTNYNVPGGTTSTSTGTDPALGVYELTNTDTTGAAGGASVSGTFSVPSGYSTLVVQAPGAETVDGNGATNFLAIFGAQSTVDFTSRADINNINSGTGTIIASGNNYIQVGGTYTGGQGWTIVGGASGGDTINSISENTSITTQGANNVVGLGGGAPGMATVVAGGTGDLIAGYSSSDVISVTGSGDNVLINGSFDTVYAAAGSSGLNMFFFGAGAGNLDFINNSTVGASVTGGSQDAGASGSVTVFAGIGGGYYEGGSSGNNSLVGSSATASTTLIGAGNNNVLSVDGSGANALFAGDGTATLIAGSGSANNLFSGGLGTDIMSSEGSGFQNFFIGTTGSETLTGSSVSGSLNTYYVNQAVSQGGGTDVLTDFRYGTDQVLINPTQFTTVSGVSVQGISEVGNTSLVQLTDSTIIKLVGVTFTAAEQATIVGSTHF